MTNEQAEKEWQDKLGFKSGDIKPIPNHPFYWATKDGDIISTKYSKPRKLKPSCSNTGYLKVTLSRKGTKKIETWSIHRLVLLSFVGPMPENMNCAHLNGNRTDNRIKNLAYVTPLENSNHKYIHGTVPIGEDVHNAKLTNEQAEEIRKRHRRFSKYRTNRKELAKEYGVPLNVIHYIVNGKSYKKMGGGE